MSAEHGDRVPELLRRSSQVVRVVGGDVELTPPQRPYRATVRPPGSKSLTNRALLAAALAMGESQLTGILFADDTEAMLETVNMLGAGVELDRTAQAVRVSGVGGRWRNASVEVDARLSGTTSRFVAATLALGPGSYRLDGAAPLRARPMDEAIGALRHLGAQVDEQGVPGHLPVVVRGGPVAGGVVRVDGSVSSQFLSGLLLAGPCFNDGLTVEVTTPLVSRPYVELTTEVMGAFGAVVELVECSGDVPTQSYVVAPGGYRGTDYDVEPDASAASYLVAAAVLTGGSVRVEGLGRSSRQGDVGFIDVLEQMGASVRWEPNAVTVSSSGALRGITVDMRDLSDTAQTLAAVAVFAEGPTEVSGIGFIRHKETDRIAAVVTELQRCGVEASATDDGFVIAPGAPRPALVQTYDDHRMAMAFSLLGLRARGIRIADAGCVAKTFPQYWDVLASLEDDSGLR